MIRTGQRLIVWVAPTVIKVNSQPTLPTTSLVIQNNKTYTVQPVTPCGIFLKNFPVSLLKNKGPEQFEK